MCPILMVFGVLPRPARKEPSLTQYSRSKAIEDGIIEAEKEQSKRRISFGIRSKGSPICKEESQKLQLLPAGSKVLVYRTKSKTWEGPFTFISVDRETAVIQTKVGRSIFRSSCVKSYIKSSFM